MILLVSFWISKTIFCIFLYRVKKKINKPTNFHRNWTWTSNYDYKQSEQISSKSDNSFSCYCVYKVTYTQTDKQTKVIMMPLHKNWQVFIFSILLYLQQILWSCLLARFVVGKPGKVGYHDKYHCFRKRQQRVVSFTKNLNDFTSSSIHTGIAGRFSS